MGVKKLKFTLPEYTFVAAVYKNYVLYPVSKTKRLYKNIF